MTSTDSAIQSLTRESAEHRWKTTAWCLIAAFGAYFCTYVFRKPFAASQFQDGQSVKVWDWEIDYKTLLVFAQLIGYALSKFVGIKVISEITRRGRIAAIAALIATAEAALLAFAIVPPPYNCVCLFLNGLPLGMVFGIVLAFVEGRRVTELLTAGLCASFILADGAATSIGGYLLNWNVPEPWMPFVAGLIAAGPMAFFIWMLAQIPPPSPADVEQRSVRLPMDARRRWRFFWTYAAGLTALVVMYTLITVLRTMRSYYLPEIWSGLSAGKEKTPPSVFAVTEAIVALTVMLANGLCFLVKNSRRAFFLALSISGLGTALIAASVAGLNCGLLDGFSFMVLVGIGLYLPYVAVHTTIFERLIAMTRDQGNLGYLMYLADAFGYLGYLTVMLLKPRGSQVDFLHLFTRTSTIMAAASFACILIAGVYFTKRGQNYL